MQEHICVFRTLLKDKFKDTSKSKIYIYNFQNNEYIYKLKLSL